jgi:hypothetical protein
MKRQKSPAGRKAAASRKMALAALSQESDKQLDELIRRGAQYVWFYTYRPIGPQPSPDHMGRFAAESVVGLNRAEVGFGRQLAGEQQQQLTQLQGEAATQQVGFEAGQAVQGQ